MGTLYWDTHFGKIGSIIEDGGSKSNLTKLVKISITKSCVLEHMYSSRLQIYVYSLVTKLSKLYNMHQGFMEYPTEICLFDGDGCWSA